MIKYHSAYLMLGTKFIFRYYALVIIVSLMVGSYYCFDNPSALSHYIQDPNGFNLSPI